MPVSYTHLKQLHGAPKVEMFLVYAGALGDLEMWDKAIEVVHTVGRSQGLPGEYRMRAVQAEQYFLEEAGRSKEAEQLNDCLLYTSWRAWCPDGSSCRRHAGSR